MMGQRQGGQGQFFYAFELDKVVPREATESADRHFYTEEPYHRSSRTALCRVRPRSGQTAEQDKRIVTMSVADTKRTYRDHQLVVRIRGNSGQTCSRGFDRIGRE